MRHLRTVTVLALCALMIVSCICVSNAKYENPQKYSMEPYGTEDEFWAEINEIQLPEEKVRDGIAVWLNKTQLDLSEKAFFKNGTVYVPFKDVFEAAGCSVSVSKKSAAAAGDGINVTAKKGKTAYDINGTKVTLKRAPKIVRGVFMVSADFIEKALDAKVWYDELSETYVITTGAMKTDDILRIINGKLWMNGEPYYEISFNKWDLALQVASYTGREAEWSTIESTLPAAEEALSMLHDNGFRTIRVFVSASTRSRYVNSEKQRNKFYAQMDTMFDLCDKYEIQMNACLALPSADFVASGETISDLYCVPESESRKNLYDFIDTFVTRYKNRRSVLMWEIVNEGNLQADIGWAAKYVCPSARILGDFYADCAARIKMNDPERLVTGGDGELRGAQFNLYKGTRVGFIGCDWTQDTLEERLYVQQMLYHGVDVISTHSYDAGRNEIYYSASREDPDTKTHQDLKLLMAEAKRLGKVLYNGETSLSCTSNTYDDSGFEKEELDEYLQETVDAGVQLTHWWTFHCDRLGHPEDMYTWDMTYGKGLAAVKEANAKLKAKYVVNALTEGKAEDSGCGSSAPLTVAALMSIAPAAVILIKKERYDEK